MKQEICPCCNSHKTEEFFRIKNAPVQSVVTVKSYEEAISIPRMDITCFFQLKSIPVLQSKSIPI
jgi:hypothetical protein